MKKIIGFTITVSSTFVDMASEEVFGNYLRYHFNNVEKKFLIKYNGNIEFGEWKFISRVRPMIEDRDGTFYEDEKRWKYKFTNEAEIDETTTDKD